MSTFHRNQNTFVGKVHLRVENFSRSLNFYQNFIGFHILEQSENKAILTADGKIPLLIIEQTKNVIPQNKKTTGLYHFALLLPTRTDLANILQHFIQAGYPLGGSDHLVSEALYLSDPDGNGIEIYIDRPSSSWDWTNNNVVMSTDPLDTLSLLSEAQNVPWNTLPADTVIGHIHLHVAELQKTETFYTMGLGFDVVNRYGNQALFVSTGNYHHHIGLNTWNGVGAPTPLDNSVGLISYSLVFDNEDSRKHTIATLRNLGYSVTEESGNLYTSDPSGNRIQLVV